MCQYDYSEGIGGGLACFLRLCFYLSSMSFVAGGAAVCSAQVDKPLNEVQLNRAIVPISVVFVLIVVSRYTRMHHRECNLCTAVHASCRLLCVLDHNV